MLGIIIAIILIVVLFGGGGYGYHAGYYGSGPIYGGGNIISLILALFLIWLILRLFGIL